MGSEMKTRKTALKQARNLGEVFAGRVFGLGWGNVLGLVRGVWVRVTATGLQSKMFLRCSDYRAITDHHYQEQNTSVYVLGELENQGICGQLIGRIRLE